MHTCARRFVGKGIEYDDLYQEGWKEFIKAVKNFDLDKVGVASFRTYSKKYIEYAVSNEFSVQLNRLGLTERPNRHQFMQAVFINSEMAENSNFDIPDIKEDDIGSFYDDYIQEDEKKKNLVAVKQKFPNLEVVTFKRFLNISSNIFSVLFLVITLEIKSPSPQSSTYGLIVAHKVLTDCSNGKSDDLACLSYTPDNTKALAIHNASLILGFATNANKLCIINIT